ncbi:MAG TPA: site-2 protease family protein [Pyrinomonadaceae bacterium]|jgi:Zn-dependent protease|nr:site-2 protease family protein [Pyrinomonadaceae bacterium]
MPTDILGQLIIYLVVLLFAISAHEASHAWMSHKFGDDTAYMLGRVTLNPTKHIDPIGTLLIPVAGFIYGAMGGAYARMLIGWGKPTPVNPLRWRNKDTANVMVSLAGIMANISIAAVTLVVVKVIQYTGLAADGGLLESVREPVAIFLEYSLRMNVSLAVFNLLPFPPLDGSKVLYSVLPASSQPTLEFLERYGFIILLVFLYFGWFGAIFAPFARLINYLVAL